MNGVCRCRNELLLYGLEDRWERRCRTGRRPGYGDIRNSRPHWERQALRKVESMAEHDRFFYTLTLSRISTRTRRTYHLSQSERFNLNRHCCIRKIYTQKRTSTTLKLS